MSCTPNGQAPNELTGQDWATWYCNFDVVRSRPAEDPNDTVFVAHMDTGLVESANVGPSFLETRFSANLIEGKSREPWTPLDELPEDELGGFVNFNNHGTATYSVVAGSSPIHAALDGISGIKYVPYRITTFVGLKSDELTYLCEALGHFTERLLNEPGGGPAPHVLALSLGSRFFSQKKVEKLLRTYARQGVIIVAAGGQVPFGPAWREVDVVFPANRPWSVGVGAIDRTGEPNQLGFYDEAELDVVSPGINIRITRAYEPATGSVARVVGESTAGSSYSTQFVAAAAALWIRHHGKTKLRMKYGLGKTVSAFIHCLRASAGPANRGWPERTLAGQLNVDCLLDQPLPDASGLELP
ncbi:S8/S53 family peptidase [Maribius pontilimi]|uniref:S8/S53 family peptidase n=1 Tax=Palleronia pontilimi TaxID=1964209 RepID=A0A934MGI9_9RHOB|nr:S8/S53 family peptidase [Palleronia pontilimi]MBJ3762439.1 S8/S53 family peptidase [Palleronia pontilimi]